MIKSLTITNHLGDSIVLELARPEKSGFVVKHIEGLGPVDAVVNMTDTATHNGSMYNSARLNRRDIVLNLGFLQIAGESVADIRRKSYKYFPLMKNVRILIETEKRTLVTDGYVQSNQPDIFSSEEGASIIIQCEDSFLYSPTNNRTTFSGVEPLFEFPFENPSVSQRLIELGSIRNNVTKIVSYEGESEIGIDIDIRVMGEAGNITISNVTTSEQMFIDTTKLASIVGDGRGLLVGDNMLISTEIGKRSATLIREGRVHNIFNCIRRDSDWFTLAKGDNIFVYRDDSGKSNLRFEVINRIAYVGV